jgi:hypothetical protein
MNGDWRVKIATTLRTEGYNVLEAEDLPGCLHIAKTHSRPIQLLLSGLRCDPAFMDLMQQLRPGMDLMLFTREEMFHEPNRVMERVRQFFAPPTGESESKRSREASPWMRARTAEAS